MMSNMQVQSESVAIGGNAHLQVSAGERTDDRINELIGSLHIHIAEMVRIFAETQRSNRDFSKGFAEVREAMTSTARSLAELQGGQSRDSLELSAIHQSTTMGATNSARLSQLIGFIHELSAAMSGYIDTANVKMGVVGEQLRAIGSNQAEDHAAVLTLGEDLTRRLKDVNPLIAGSYAEVRKDIIEQFGLVKQVLGATLPEIERQVRSLFSRFAGYEAEQEREHAELTAKLSTCEDRLLKQNEVLFRSSSRQMDAITSLSEKGDANLAVIRDELTSLLGAMDWRITQLIERTWSARIQSALRRLWRFVCGNR